MSQPTKPISAKQPKSTTSQPTDQALPETDLDQVTGGKAKPGDIVITHTYDKSSPSLG